MTVYDFSSGFNLLNQGINSLGEALSNRTNAQGYSGIGAALQQGDWEGAASRAWAMGNPDLAMKLQMQGYAMRGGSGYPPIGGGGDSNAPAPASLKPTDATKPDATAAPAAGPTAVPGGLPSPGGRWAPADASANDVQSYIYNAAVARGIDPNIAVRVAHSEWGKSYTGDAGKSFGPFQLFTGGGLGNEFTSSTGLNPADPSTWKAQVDFALDTAARKGSWADWHGARAVGIPNNAGLENARPLGTISTAGNVQAAAPGTTQLPAAPAASRFGPGGFAGVGTTPAPAQPAAPAPAPAPAPAAAASPAPAATPVPAPPPVTPPRPQPWQPGQGFRPAQAGMPGVPLNAPEQAVDAAARALATNLPGAPTPQQQAAAAANPPGIGGVNLGTLLGARPPAPAPAPSPGANIPAAYGQPPAPQAPAPQPPAPPSPAAQLQPLVQALQSGRITMRELLANPQAYGLPDPRTPQGQPIWQVLGAAATSTGRGAGQGPPTPAMGAQAFAGANATATSTGAAPLPPVRPTDSQPPPEMSTAATGSDPLADAIAAQTGGTRPYRPAGSQTTEEAPLPPSRPPDIGKPFPQPAPQQAALPPANTQPKSAANAPIPPSRPAGMGNLPAGVVGYLPTGEPIYAGDPEANLPRWMKGTGVGNIAERMGLAGPAPPPGAGRANWIRPQDTGSYLPAGLQPGAGAMAAGLPPGAGGAPNPGGGGGALGGALSGLGGGLLNFLSATPPQGVPGMNTPAQYLQGGQGAPLPAPPWLQQRPPGMLPPQIPGAQPGAAQPVAAPGAAPGAPGQPAAAPGQPAAPADPLDAQINGALQRMQVMRSLALQNALIPERAKQFEDEANRMQEQYNKLVEQKNARDIKAGEVSQTASADIAKKQLEGIGAAYDDVRTQGGATGLIRNVRQMRADLDAGTISGYGGAQGFVQKLGEYLAILDPASQGMVANSQEFNTLKAQENVQLLRTLLGKNKIQKAEYQNFVANNASLAQRPDVIRNMLDAAEDRGMDQIRALNESIDRFQKVSANKPFAEAAEAYRVDPNKLPLTPRPAAGQRGAGPQAAGAAGTAKEGDIIKNNTTGERQILRNGQWQPLQ